MTLIWIVLNQTNILAPTIVGVYSSLLLAEKRIKMINELNPNVFKIVGPYTLNDGTKFGNNIIPLHPNVITQMDIDEELPEITQPNFGPGFPKPKFDKIGPSKWNYF